MNLLSHAFTDKDLLDWLYNYRHHPDPAHATHAFAYITINRLLFIRQTSIGWAGVVCALCERHPEYYVAWRQDYADTIKQAMSIEKHGPAHRDITWADHLIYRWFILGRDEEPWQLLKMAHAIGATVAQKTGTQSAINRICYTQVDGAIKFEDMRLQMLRLTKDFSAMNREARKLPFASVPFGLESIAAQQAQRAALGVRQVQRLVS
jgi:hypothetical protein